MAIATSNPLPEPASQAIANNVATLNRAIGIVTTPIATPIISNDIIPSCRSRR